jgi:hypothetical protein
MSDKDATKKKKKRMYAGLLPLSGGLHDHLRDTLFERKGRDCGGDESQSEEYEACH